MKKLILLAVVLRLILSIVYFHPDIKTYSFQSSYLKKGVFNIYPYLINNKDNLPLKEEFVYFPLTYFTLGTYQAIISPFVGGFLDNWLTNADVNSIVTDKYVFFDLLILKLPIFLMDLFIAYLLYENIDKKTSLIWLFNPFTIVIFYVYSNVDIFPIALTVWSLILAKKEKYITSGILLGLAAGYKAYPLLLAPFLFAKGKSLKEKIIYSLTPFIVFGLIILPFWSRDFVNSALISGLTTRIVTPVFIVFYLIIFIYSNFFDKKYNLINCWIAAMLLVYCFANYHIQWLAWIAPFLIILIAKNQKLLWISVLFSVTAFIVPILTPDKYISVALLKVFNPAFDLVSSPYEILTRFVNPQIIQRNLHLSLIPITALLLYKNKKYA